MRKVFNPVELTEEQEKILREEVINFEGLKKIAENKIEIKLGMTDYLVMNYLAQKEKMLNMRLKKISEEVDVFNESVEIATGLGISQNINGEALKKFDLKISKEYVR